MSNYAVYNMQNTDVKLRFGEEQDKGGYKISISWQLSLT
jgi:hypothetical protein